MKLLEAMEGAQVFDLAQPLFVGAPHFPTHPPFLYSLNKLHGDYTIGEGVSSAAETITLGGHVGTHIDALNHFSCDGRLFGGAEPRQAAGAGVHPHSVDTIEPILRRGVLFDVARHQGVEALAADFVVRPEHLEAIAQKDGIDLRTGDVALLRTGWARYWADPPRFITGGNRAAVAGPGPPAGGGGVAQREARVRGRLGYDCLRAHAFAGDGGPRASAG